MIKARISLLVSTLLTAFGTLCAQTTSFAFAGDIMMGTTFPDDSKGIYLPKNDGRNLFDDVRLITRSVDVAAGNLEGVFMEPGGKAKKCSDPSVCYVFRMPPSYVANLTDAGFDFMSVANNHVNDFGAQGMKSTYATLSGADLASAGLTGINESAIIERAGKKIGFAAFSPSAGTLNMLDISSAKRIISNLDSICDLVVVSFHGGAEGPKVSHVPHAMEEAFGYKRGNVEAFARAAVDAGADIVYGHGPHVVRAMEIYNGHIIMYSLGNFCTPYRVNLAGICGYAPLVTVDIDDTGKFVKGHIHPFIQQRGQGPLKDDTGKVIKQIRNLSISDFPATYPHIEDNGVILPRN